MIANYKQEILKEYTNDLDIIYKEYLEELEAINNLSIAQEYDSIIPKVCASSGIGQEGNAQMVCNIEDCAMENDILDFDNHNVDDFDNNISIINDSYHLANMENLKNKVTAVEDGVFQKKAKIRKRNFNKRKIEENLDTTKRFKADDGTRMQISPPAVSEEFMKETNKKLSLLIREIKELKVENMQLREKTIIVQPNTAVNAQTAHIFPPTTKSAPTGNTMPHRSPSVFQDVSFHSKNAFTNKVFKNSNKRTINLNKELRRYTVNKLGTNTLGNNKIVTQKKNSGKENMIVDLPSNNKPKENALKERIPVKAPTYFKSNRSAFISGSKQTQEVSIRNPRKHTADRMTPSEMYKRSIDMSMSHSNDSLGAHDSFNTSEKMTKYKPRVYIPKFTSDEEMKKQVISAKFVRTGNLIEKVKSQDTDEIRKLLGNQTDINVTGIFKGKIDNVTNSSPNKYQKK